jgi:formyl-CoA transferase
MLTGVRVIDLGTVITAPFAGMMLGDLGADVIKVERPEGDPFRNSQGGGGYAPTFVAYNRNKRSVVLDLNVKPDRDMLLQLIDDADVLLDNFRPGVLERLGLAPDLLTKRNPKLIQCSITGFGSSGPYRDRPAFDSVGLAVSGLASLLIDPDAPEFVGPTISDNVTGLQTCCAILAALVERGRTGRGRRLEVNMLEATMAFAPDAFTSVTRLGVVPQRLSRVTNSQSFAFRCCDDRLLAIHLSTQEKFWTGLLEALEAPELGVDPRFLTHRKRTQTYLELRDELARRFLARPSQVWLDRLTRADVPAALILNSAQAMEDAQVIALGSVCETIHPIHGSVRSIACPILVDGTRPRREPTAPPTLGEHTAAVLGSLKSRAG